MSVSTIDLSTKPLPVLARVDEGLHHLRLLEVAAKLVQFIEPELEATLIRRHGASSRSTASSQTLSYVWHSRSVWFSAICRSTPARVELPLLSPLTNASRSL